MFTYFLNNINLREEIYWNMFMSMYYSLYDDYNHSDKDVDTDEGDDTGEGNCIYGNTGHSTNHDCLYTFYSGSNGLNGKTPGKMLSVTYNYLRKYTNFM